VQQRPVGLLSTSLEDRKAILRGAGAARVLAFLRMESYVLDVPDGFARRSLPQGPTLVP
jgi:hypothetical protein